MKAKAKPRVNDLVRVVQSNGKPGPTLYLLEWIGERGRCVIREAGKPLAGGQEFDLSLLVKVDRDAKPKGRLVTLEKMLGSLLG